MENIPTLTEEKLVDCENQNTNDEKIIDNAYEKEEVAIESKNVEHDTESKMKKCLFIELNPGFSYFNLYSYYLVQFGYVMAFTFIDACQDYLLESEKYDYKINHSETGKINGDILVFDTLYLVCLNLIKKFLNLFFL